MTHAISERPKSMCDKNVRPIFRPKLQFNQKRSCVYVFFAPRMFAPSSGDPLLHKPGIEGAKVVIRIAFLAGRLYDIGFEVGDIVVEVTPMAFDGVCAGAAGNEHGSAWREG